MSDRQPSHEKYIPTPEELAGDAWQYCYGQHDVIPPPKDEDRDGHSQ